MVSSAWNVSGARVIIGVPAATAWPWSNSTAVTRPAISGWTTTASLARREPVARMRVAARPASASAVSTGTARARGPATSRALVAGSANRYQPPTAPAAPRSPVASSVISGRVMCSH